MERMNMLNRGAACFNGAKEKGIERNWPEALSLLCSYMDGEGSDFNQGIFQALIFIAKISLGGSGNPEWEKLRSRERAWRAVKLLKEGLADVGEDRQKRFFTEKVTRAKVYSVFSDLSYRTGKLFEDRWDPRACECFEAGADWHISCAYETGNIYFYGQKKDAPMEQRLRDNQRAEKYYRKAADSGLVDAWDALGTFYVNQDIPDYEMGIYCYRCGYALLDYLEKNGQPGQPRTADGKRVWSIEIEENESWLLLSPFIRTEKTTKLDLAEHLANAYLGNRNDYIIDGRKAEQWIQIAEGLGGGKDCRRLQKEKSGGWFSAGKPDFEELCAKLRAFKAANKKHSQMDSALLEKVNFADKSGNGKVLYYFADIDPYAEGMQEYMLRAADYGSLKAQLFISRSYYSDTNAEAKRCTGNRAFVLTAMAARQNNREALYQLYLLFTEGYRAPVDQEHAKGYWNRLCMTGYRGKKPEDSLNERMAEEVKQKAENWLELSMQGYFKENTLEELRLFQIKSESGQEEERFSAKVQLANKYMNDFRGYYDRPEIAGKLAREIDEELEKMQGAIKEPLVFVAYGLVMATMYRRGRGKEKNPWMSEECIKIIDPDRKMFTEEWAALEEEKKKEALRRQEIRSLREAKWE